MGRRQVFEILVMVGLWLTVAFFVYLHFHRHTEPAPVPKALLPTRPASDQGRHYDVKKITVLRGDNFDLTLKDGSRVLGKLSVLAVDDAKEKVLDLFNHSTNPKVVLREKQPDGRWVVEISFQHNGREWTLTEWLQTNGLVYK